MGLLRRREDAHVAFLGVVVPGVNDERAFGCMGVGLLLPATRAIVRAAQPPSDIWTRQR